MSEQQLISIIVPVYNVENYLNKCLDSILCQTYDNFEVLLIDDGSLDGSPQICEEYAKRDNRVRVIHKMNGGVSEARNDGIKNAKGAFLCFVDSDDYVSPNYLSALVGSQQENNADVVFGKYCKDISGKIVYMHEDLKTLINEKKIAMFFSDKEYVMGSMCRLLLRKSIFETINFDKSLKYCEDLYFVLNLFLIDLKFSYTNETIYYYFCNSNSVTQKFNSKTSYYYEAAMLKCIELLKNNIQSCLKQSILFEIYTMAIKQACVTKKYSILKDFEKYNTKCNYVAYKKNNATFKSKVKAFLCRHKMFWLLKFFY